MPLTAHTHYHLVGIQGVGMAALAQILMDQGMRVSGSDTGEEFETNRALRARGITLYQEFSPDHIKGADIVVYSGAHGGEGNEEVQAARRAAIPVMSLASQLGVLSQSKRTIAVCGCHGKTTTTALSAFLADAAGEHPSYYVGSTAFNDLSGGRWDEKGEAFYVEADEYVIDPESRLRAKFLELSPFTVIATRYDYDHVDVYPREELLKRAYTDFFVSIPHKGFLVINGDDRVWRELAHATRARVVSVGFDTSNEIRISLTEQGFELTRDDKSLGKFSLSLLGRHNVLNAALVLTSRLMEGKPLDSVAKSLPSFTGAHRRLEPQGSIGTTVVYDDYAHHPTEISATIDAIRQTHPECLLAILFQPHTYSRTRAFSHQFVEALSHADEVGMLPIFASKRERAETKVVSSLDLVREGLATKTRFQLVDPQADSHALNAWLSSWYQPQKPWVIVTMGAGDVYLCVHDIISYLHKAHGD